MNIIQAVKYMMRVLIPQITPIAGEGIEVAKEKEGSVISATFPGWLPHGEVYVGNSTNAAWAAGTVVALGASAVADPLEDTLAASIPAAGADGQFAVLSDAIAVQDDGLAAVTGLAVARMSAGWTEAFAVPDGLGGLAGAASGPFRVIYASQSAGEALVAFAGGGGAAPAPVADNTADLFKIYEYSATNVRVKSGVVYLGGLNVTTSESSSIGVTSTKRYIYVQVTYSNGALSAQINYNSTIQVPDNSSSYRYTLGCVYLDANNAIKIEQWHYPSPVIIYNRWIG